MEKKTPKNNKHRINIPDALYNKACRTSFQRNFTDIFREALKTYLIAKNLKEYAHRNNINLFKIFENVFMLMKTLKCNLGEKMPGQRQDRTIYLDDITNKVFLSAPQADIENSVLMQAEFSESRNLLITMLQKDANPKTITYLIANLITIIFFNGILKIENTELHTDREPNER